MTSCHVIADRALNPVDKVLQKSRLQHHKVDNFDRKQYCDVIMGVMASQITSLTFIQAQIKENIKAPRHLPLCGEFTGDRWIPLTKGSNEIFFPFDDVIMKTVTWTISNRQHAICIAKGTNKQIGLLCFVFLWLHDQFPMNAFIDILRSCFTGTRNRMIAAVKWP